MLYICVLILHARGMQARSFAGVLVTPVSTSKASILSTRYAGEELCGHNA